MTDPFKEENLYALPPAGLKIEGGVIHYPPRRPMTRWERLRHGWLGLVLDRLIWLPHRLWWALFGGTYY